MILAFARIVSASPSWRESEFWLGIVTSVTVVTNVVANALVDEPRLEVLKYVLEDETQEAFWKSVFL